MILTSSRKKVGVLWAFLLDTISKNVAQKLHTQASGFLAVARPSTPKSLLSPRKNFVE